MLEKIYEVKEYLLSKKYLLIIMSIFILIIIISCFIIFNNKSKKTNGEIDLSELVKMEDVKEEQEIENEKETCSIKVDIKGYVLNPGLYEVNCEARVFDVINLAGGLKNNADTSVINLGKKVFDQMVIIIYSKEEVNNFVEVVKKEEQKQDKCENKEIVKNDACITKENKIESNVTVTDNDNSNINNNTTLEEKKLISINTATKEELMTLSGIGESKALSIISYREEHGLFSSIEEIKNISGIGDKMFEKIKNSITV